MPTEEWLLLTICHKHCITNHVLQQSENSKRAYFSHLKDFPKNKVKHQEKTSKKYMFNVHTGKIDLKMFHVENSNFFNFCGIWAEKSVFSRNRCIMSSANCCFATCKAMKRQSLRVSCISL